MYLTYEERLKKIKKPGDEDKQLRLAKSQMMSLRRIARNQESLADKMLYQGYEKEAAQVVRQLRLNIFKIEDMLKDQANAL